MSMGSHLQEFRHWFRGPVGQRAIRYTLGSGIAFVISQVVFIASYGVLHLFGARGSSIFATMAGAVPSYFMNRYWAWQKRGRSHLSKEVIPYFVMAALSLVFSTWSADFASSHKEIVGSSHLFQLIFVDGAYIASFAVLWFVKYAVMDKVLFAKSKPESEKLTV
ncbi:MAG: hypothetical protein EPN30_10690 [Actinomycetota bacterium]|nr:MAG: hypothetical protein EPN30_10690 [Actinomycetota bacterium]